MDTADVQTRAVRVLTGSQVLGGVGMASGIAIGGLVAEDVTGSTSMAGLAQTATVLGAALLAVPMARLAAWRGRRPALTVGYLVGLAGALLCVLGAVTRSYPVLATGTLLFGGGTAAGLQARYAATDCAPPATRGRSLGVVVWATTLGAVVGPNLAGPGGALGRAVGVPVLAGPYLFSVAAFALATVLVLTRLRPDPLVASGRTSAAAPVAGPSTRRRTGEGLRGLLATPTARLATATMCVAHAAMVGVMAMTPVHLRHEGATLEVVGLVISGHVAGMYAASPVMGWVADRVGRVPAVLVGLGILGAAMLVAGLAPQHAHVVVGVGLFLLGLGWSACIVAGSTLLSESVAVAHRTAAQGAGDLAVGLSGASAGALAGPVLSAFGYSWLTALTAVLIAPVALLAADAVRGARGAAAARPLPAEQVTST